MRAFSKNSLVKLHLQLGEFLLPPGVEGDLGGGVAARLLQLLVELRESEKDLFKVTTLSKYVLKIIICSQNQNMFSKSKYVFKIITFSKYVSKS